MISSSGAPVPRFTSADTVTATAGQSFSSTVQTASRLPVVLSEVGALPAGLSFTDLGNGRATISGTPSTAGTYELGVLADNGIGRIRSQAFSLSVSSPIAS